jgi:hypothetical protein
MGTARLDRGRAELPACYRRFDVPGVDLCCTWCGPVTYPGCHFRRSWPCPDDARRWSANRFHLHARHGLGGRGGCVLRADAFPALVRGRRAGGPGPRRACRLPVLCVLARERCPRARHGAGGGSTGTGKTWQPAGNGFAGQGPAGSRPVRSAGLRRCRREGHRPGPGLGRERSAELADRLAGYANLRPFHVAS